MVVGLPSLWVAALGFSHLGGVRQGAALPTLSSSHPLGGNRLGAAALPHWVTRPRRPRRLIAMQDPNSDQENQAREKRDRAIELLKRAEEANREVQRLEDQAKAIAEGKRIQASAQPVENNQTNLQVEAEITANEKKNEQTDDPFVLFNLSRVETTPTGPLARAVNAMVRPDQPVTLTDEQITRMRTRVFGFDSFYVTKFKQTEVGTVFYGNLRGEPAEIFETVERSISEDEVLRNIQILLVDDPMPPALVDLQEGVERCLVFVALPQDLGPTRQSLGQLVFSILLLGLGGLTSLGYALSYFLLSSDGVILERLQAGDSSPVNLALPIAGGIFILQLLHEASHIFQARRHGISLGFPVFIPSLQLGTFGCVTNLRSFPRSRKNLFDVAIAGPAVSFVASLLIYVVGLVLTVGMPLPEAGSSLGTQSIENLVPVVPTALLESSLLLGGIADFLLPNLDGALTTPLHPAAVVGFTGCLVNALNLIPVGRLDGGRVCSAVLGPTGAGIISGLGLIFMGLSFLFFGDNQVILFFGLFFVLFQR